MRKIPVLLLEAAILAGCAHAASRSQRELQFPNCNPVRLVSPDGQWTLIAGGGPGVCCSARPLSGAAAELVGNIYLRDNRTGRTRLLDRYPGSGSLEWARDSRHFWYSSGVSNTAWLSVWQVDPFRRIDIDSLVFASHTFPQALLAATGHMYVIPLRWLGPEALSISVCGHTDQGPVTVFDYRYTVTLAGKVEETQARNRPFRSFSQPECP